jgi:hypothetical protein
MKGALSKLSIKKIFTLIDVSVEVRLCYQTELFVVKRPNRVLSY